MNEQTLNTEKQTWKTYTQIVCPNKYRLKGTIEKTAVTIQGKANTF